jgi:hypothetical protein
VTFKWSSGNLASTKSLPAYLVRSHHRGQPRIVDLKAGDVEFKNDLLPPLKDTRRIGQEGKQRFELPYLFSRLLKRSARRES